MFSLINYLIENDIDHTVNLDGNITVHGNLDLENVSEVDYLPDNLTVNGYLDLSKSNIPALPKNLTVGGSLYLNHENTSSVSYRENCGDSHRTIFAIRTGTEYRIAAGCFLGTIEQFEQAVDRKYSGDAAEAYKKSARDCVAELTEKLKIYPNNSGN